MPPKTAHAQLSLGRTIAELEPLNPSFVSVTYGAGGSTRERTKDVVTWMRSETSIAPMAHLTCVGHTTDQLDEILHDYAAADVVNILALGGDAPKDSAAGPADFTYAIDLLHHIKSTGDFCIGVAAHPEVHPRSASRADDRARLAEKLQLADFAMTQFFFEVEHYSRLVEELAALGVTKPVLPGIMPVTNINQVKRMAELSGAAFPQWFADRLEPYAADPEAIRKIGADVATELCEQLLAAGAPGLHLYTLNRSTTSREIWSNLDLSNRS
jgi:methylenetetrahydrofolate reductase (NADPH)